MGGSAWPSIAAVLAQHGGVATGRELRAAGVGEGAVRWAVGADRLRRLRHGVYVAHELWTTADPGDRHLLTVRAHQKVVPDGVAVGLSAAAVLGLPVPWSVPVEPHLATPRGRRHRGAGGRRAGAVQRRAWITDDEIIVVGGVRVTVPARAVIDCARHVPAPWALAIGDAAARRWGVRSGDVATLLRDDPPMPGKRRAGWVAVHMNPLAESPLESLPRALILRAKLPAPQLQVAIRTHRGPYRLDLLDVENRLATEADGRLKYADPMVLWEEKLRQDAIQEHGIDVIRFVMPDLARSQAWIERYRRALHRRRAPGIVVI